MPDVGARIFPPRRRADSLVSGFFGIMAPPPRMDRRTVVFLVLTLSVCVNTLLCFLGSFGLPYVKRLSPITFKAALLSALAGFAYRIAYSAKLEGFSFDALKKSVAPIVDTNGFGYSLYILIFLNSRPMPTVLFPLAVCAAFQAASTIDKHFGHTTVYQSVGAGRLFAYAQENMHQAMMMCATMEISMLPVCLAELLTPARSISKVVMLVNLLRRRYACTDNTVFRIKFTYYNTGYYHQQFWNMIDEKTSPLVARLGPLGNAVGALKAWFTAGAAANAKAR